MSVSHQIPVRRKIRLVGIAVLMEASWTHKFCSSFAPTWIGVLEILLIPGTPEMSRSHSPILPLDVSMTCVQ